MSNRDSEQTGIDPWNGGQAVQRASERRESSVPAHLLHVETRISNLRDRITQGKGTSEYVSLTEIAMYEEFRGRILREIGRAV